MSSNCAPRLIDEQRCFPHSSCDKKQRIPGRISACEEPRPSLKIRAMEAKRYAGEEAPATLGDVLYPDKSKAAASEKEWVALVRAIAAGDQPALHDLYERANRVVYTLILRI